MARHKHCPQFITALLNSIDTQFSSDRANVVRAGTANVGPIAWRGTTREDSRGAPCTGDGSALGCRDAE